MRCSKSTFMHINNRMQQGMPLYYLLKTVNYRPGTEVCKALVSRHAQSKNYDLRAREFRPLSHDLFYSIQEIALRGNLPSCANREHPSLYQVSNSLYRRVLPLTSVATDRSSAPVVLGHNRAMRSNRISRSTLILLGSEPK